ncbi:methyltransferase domain-containing protein [Aquiflexum sp.]|uniref:class I SAM-dependent methyltransferase n=1 Tax=Aquiflexum sp. TaxID=1872584 RepID=UPI003592E898
MKKSTVKEIRTRFDKDVERFSNLQKGQTSTVDAVATLEILSDSAKYLCPGARDILDIGCGAGNYTLKILEKIPNLNCTLIDLSQPMLDKARERVSNATDGEVICSPTDVRDFPVNEESFDIITAGAVLHHLRDESEWEAVFKKLFSLLKPGGVLLISDLVVQTLKPLNKLMWERYADYLKNLNGEAYQKDVFAYIVEEDSPRSYEFQQRKLNEAGFAYVEILHKNMCFATFCAVKEKSGGELELMAPGETVPE